jgi:hypothetical protein
MRLGRISLSIGVLVAGCGSEVAPPAQPGRPAATAMAPRAEATTARWRSAESGISAIDLKRHVAFLASDELAGRETLKPGADKAAAYIAERFAEYGLEKLPGQSAYRIGYTLEEQGWDAAATRLTWKRGGVAKTLRPGVDFEPLQPTDEKPVKAPVVFAGYGIHAPDKGWDDYAGLDVKGKIVLVLRHIPNEKALKAKAEAAEAAKQKLDETKTLGAMDGAFTAKARAAMDRGAIGMMVVTEPSHESDDELSLAAGLRVPLTAEEKAEEAAHEKKTLAAKKPDPNAKKPDPRAKKAPRDRLFVSAMLSRAAADELVSAGGRSLAQLQQAVDGGAKPKKLALGAVRVDLAVKSAATPRRVTAENVVGFLPGSDPARRDEWVVVGGHYDHVGEGGLDGDRIHNGADDNASGTSGVLEIAQAFASLPAAARPARSLVFVTFSGEEKGLLGSDAILSQGTLPIEKLVFMLNLDMIGRNPDKKVEILGDAFATVVQAITDEENRDVKVDMEWSGKNYAPNSDHHSFFKRSIPSMFFFTGTHPDYHQPGDHADKLAYDNMEKLSRLGFRIVGRVAEGDVTPQYIHQITWLGVAIEIDAEKRARVIEVESGSRGERAGLKVGDIVAAVGDAIVTDSRSLGKAWNGLEPGVTAPVRVTRGGSEVALEVQRAKRGFLGIQSGEVSDEVRKKLGLGPEEGFSVDEVVADGPAAKAGLRAGDVVITLAGASVNQRNLFAALYRLGAGEKVTAVVGRDGARLSIPMTLGTPPER